jgi:hypothetical protein
MPGRLHVRWQVVLEGEFEERVRAPLEVDDPFAVAEGAHSIVHHGAAHGLISKAENDPEPDLNEQVANAVGCQAPSDRHPFSAARL